MNRTFTLLALMTATICHAQYGTLDPSFGNGGYVTHVYDTASGNSFARDMAVLSNGDIICIGEFYTSQEEYLAIAKLSPNGELDTGFANNGIALHGLWTMPDEYETFEQLLVQSDGKLLVGGLLDWGTWPAYKDNIILTRLNSDGTLDSTFGSAGKLMITYPTDSSMTFGRMALQSDGKILVCGTFSNERKAVVIRLSPSGELDTGFGTDGFAFFEVNPNSIEQGRDVVMLSDGSIVALGEYLGFGGNAISILARFDQNGILDPVFDGDGVVEHDIGPESDEVWGLELSSTGKILVAGLYEDGQEELPMVFRVNANGSLDASYGTNGLMLFNSVDATEVHDTYIQPDDKLIVCGRAWNGNGPFSSDLLLVRANADGTPDPTFGYNGVTLSQPGSALAPHTMTGIDVSPDGDLYACGFFGNNMVNDVVQVLLRYAPGPISIDEITPSTTIIYPNPAIDEVMLTFEQNTSIQAIDIHALDGRLLHSLPVNSYSPALSHRITLPGTIPMGNYLLVLKTENGQIAQPLSVM